MTSPTEKSGAIEWVNSGAISCRLHVETWDGLGPHHQRLAAAVDLEAAGFVPLAALQAASAQLGALRSAVAVLGERVRVRWLVTSDAISGRIDEILCAPGCGYTGPFPSEPDQPDSSEQGGQGPTEDYVTRAEWLRVLDHADKNCGGAVGYVVRHLRTMLEDRTFTELEKKP